MTDIVAVLEGNVLVIALAAIVLSAVAIVLAVTARGRGPDPVSRAPLRVTDEAALHRILAAERERLDALISEVGGIAAHVREVETHARRAVRRVGLVRYNPFEDTGSNQSFCLALVDDDGNGLILSSLHSRQATRIYTKQVVGWRSDGALSREEADALSQAQAR